MKKSRFTESQVVAILQKREAGVPVARLARKHGIGAATYYTGSRSTPGLACRNSSGCDVSPIRRAVYSQEMARDGWSEGRIQRLGRAA